MKSAMLRGLWLQKSLLLLGLAISSLTQAQDLMSARIRQSSVDHFEAVAQFTESQVVRIQVEKRKSEFLVTVSDPLARAQFSIQESKDPNALRRQLRQNLAQIFTEKVSFFDRALSIFVPSAHALLGIRMSPGAEAVTFWLLTAALIGINEITGSPYTLGDWLFISADALLAVDATYRHFRLRSKNRACPNRLEK